MGRVAVAGVARLSGVWAEGYAGDTALFSTCQSRSAITFVVVPRVLGMNTGCTDVQTRCDEWGYFLHRTHIAERRDPGIIGIECPLEPDGA